MNWRALRVMLEKEFKQIWRDKLVSRMLFISPLMQLVLLSTAATFEVTRATLWVVDQDRTPTATALVDRLTASGRFAVVGASVTATAGEQALREGRASTVLTIPPGFSADLQSSRRASVQLVLNAVNGSQAGVTQGYAAQIITPFRRRSRMPPWPLRPRHPGGGRQAWMCAHAAGSTPRSTTGSSWCREFWCSW